MNENNSYQVITHFRKLRNNITQSLLTDFGFSHVKYQARIDKLRETHPNIPPERLHQLEERGKQFMNFFLADERSAVISLLRCIGYNIIAANSVFAKDEQLYTSRINYNNEAIKYCFMLKHELQYIIETLPVDINKFTHYALEIDKQIALIKGAQKSDKKRFYKSAMNAEAQKTASMYTKIFEAIQHIQEIKNKKEKKDEDNTKMKRYATIINSDVV